MLQNLKVHWRDLILPSRWRTRLFGREPAKAHALVPKPAGYSSAILEAPLLKVPTALADKLSQHAHVRLLMADGKWHTLNQLHAATGYPVASISARLRGLRAQRPVQSRCLGGRTWVYRVSCWIRREKRSALSTYHHWRAIFDSYQLGIAVPIGLAPYPIEIFNNGDYPTERSRPRSRHRGGG